MFRVRNSELEGLKWNTTLAILLLIVSARSGSSPSQRPSDQQPSSPASQPIFSPLRSDMAMESSLCACAFMLAHASQRWVLFAFFFLGLAASIFPHHLCGRMSVQLAGTLSPEAVGLYWVFLLIVAVRVVFGKFVGMVVC